MPYREAVASRLVDAGLDVFDAEEAEHDPAQTVVVAYCATEAHWQRVEGLEGYLGGVVVVEEMQPQLYVRALRSGLGVVHIDTKSEAIAAVVMAAGRGEAVVPMEVARRLAQSVAIADLHTSHDLDPIETDLVRSIARGETLVSIADRYYYSERTLRRRLHSAYLKLGVQDRAGAIRAADRLGLL